MTMAMACTKYKVLDPKRSPGVVINPFDGSHPVFASLRSFTHQPNRGGQKMKKTVYHWVEDIEVEATKMGWWDRGWYKGSRGVKRSIEAGGGSGEAKKARLVAGSHSGGARAPPAWPVLGHASGKALGYHDSSQVMHGIPRVVAVAVPVQEPAGVPDGRIPLAVHVSREVGESSSSRQRGAAASETAGHAGLTQLRRGQAEAIENLMTPKKA